MIGSGVRNQRREDGFTTLWMLGLTVIVLVLGLAVFEVWHVYVVQRRMTAMADAAAAAGAQAIDADAYSQSGTIQLIDGGANSAQELAGARLGVDVRDAGLKLCPALDPARTCVTSAVSVVGANPGGPPTVVTVTVQRRVQFSVFSYLGLNNMTVSASSSASPTQR